MNRLFLGSLLAALALFVWGFLFWGQPWGNPGVQNLSLNQSEAVLSTLGDAVPESGTYFVPDPTDTDNMDRLMELHERGPIAMIFVRKEGINPMAPTVFLLGFLQCLLTAFLIGLVLRAVAAQLPTYRSRVTFAALIGIAAAVWVNLADPIWWHHPWAFHLVSFAYDLGAWVLCGAILARFVDSRT